MKHSSILSLVLTIVAIVLLVVHVITNGLKFIINSPTYKVDIMMLIFVLVCVICTAIIFKFTKTSTYYRY